MKRALLALAIVLAIPVIAIAQDAAPPATMNTHVTMTPADLKWGAPPPGLPAAVQVAVLQGNPGEAGVFTVRLKMPANAKIMPHFHATDEIVTVISGQFMMGMGDTFDAKGKALGAGGFAVLPATMHHYAMAKTACIVQVNGMGPFTITYVNPSDDPRNTPTATK